MDIERKIELVQRKPTEEVITGEGLREMFQSYAHPRHYIGFEISGKVHLGTGLCTALKIRDFMEAGIKPTIFLADYHAWINDKLGGDLEHIRKVGLGYFKHAFISLGLDEGKVQYVLASDTYDETYWPEVLRIVKDTTIKRMLRCVTIMGRKESDALKSSAILYPAMQAADIFKLDVQLAHAGMDQRKVHMLAWEAGQKLGKKFVSVHGHLLPGLQGKQRMNVQIGSPHTVDKRLQDAYEHGEDGKEHARQLEIDAKMSKSVPSSAIFIHDSVEDIESKIKKAYCPEKLAEGNPVVEYAEYLVLRHKEMKIERPAKFGGDIVIADADELKRVYSEGKLHPMDLKAAVSRELSAMLQPSRDYFAKHREYLEQMESATITR